MADIQWPSATYWNKAWNPIIGCKPCSPACDNCYARALATRFNKSFAPHPSAQKRPPRSGVVFCGNMTDLFGEWTKGTRLPELLIREAIGKRHTDATYLWLTKRVGQMCVGVQKAFNSEWRKTRRFYHYFGFTGENQECYDERHLYVIGKPDGFPMWTKWWVSCEPLLGPVRLWMPPAFRAPSWVVVGCESGPHRRPCKLEWVESIVDQCLTAGVPVFVKQLDINGKCERDITKFPKRLQYRQVPWIQTRRTPCEP